MTVVAEPITAAPEDTAAAAAANAAGRASAEVSKRPSLWSKIKPQQAPVPWHRILAATVAGTLTIAVLGLAGDAAGMPLLISAFGSSCVLVFLLPHTPLAQPINVVGGHCIAAVCGLAAHAVLPTTWWSFGLATGLAMAVMAATRTIHPPAGGTPIAILMSHEGWGYLFTPVLLGAFVLTSCALLYRLLLWWAGSARDKRVAKRKVRLAQ